MNLREVTANMEGALRICKKYGCELFEWERYAALEEEVGWKKRRHPRPPFQDRRSKYMSINLKDVFTPPTHAAIKGVYVARNWQDIDSYVEPEVAAEMFFRLRVLEDSQVYFPRGKWATIQQLESALDSHYRTEEG